MKQFAEEHPHQISPAEVRMIFVNIEEIAEIHRQFLHDLKEVKSTLEQRMEYDEEEVADVLPEKSRKSRRRLYPKWFKISRKSLKREKEREDSSSTRKPAEDGLVRPCFGPLFLKHVRTAMQPRARGQLASRSNMDDPPEQGGGDASHTGRRRVNSGATRTL